MKPFTIRDIDCQKIIECDDGDMILQHCKGQLLYLHKGYNSLPHYAEFNLRLTKELLSKGRHIMTNKVKGKVLKSLFKNKISNTQIVKDFDEYMDDHRAMSELSVMSGLEAIKIIREVWNGIKGGF